MQNYFIIPKNVVIAYCSLTDPKDKADFANAMITYFTFGYINTDNLSDAVQTLVDVTVTDIINFDDSIQVLVTDR